MLCTSSPLASPAGSEISVGAPSPPPEHHHHGDDYFKPLKRLKGISSSRGRSSSPLSRSSLEGVKSFSIADILGHEDQLNNIQNPNHLLHHHHHHHHQTTKIVRPWDHLRGPVPVRPFLPPALLHYEHRLALDYQRQLHEHLNAQAQLLRHMNMSMDIIPSESGSDRSSSAASDCCSPEINSRLSDQHSGTAGGGGRQSSPHSSSSTQQSSSHPKTKPNGTPLDALFQMTNKSFEEAQGENGTGNFYIIYYQLFSQRDLNTFRVSRNHEVHLKTRNEI